MQYKIDSISIQTTLDTSTKEMSVNNGYKSANGCCGAYFIKDDTIILKRQGGRSSEVLYTDVGIIINDTTFEIMQAIVTGSMANEENRIKNVSAIYHFRAFYPKSDITNTIISIKNNK